MSGNTHHPAYGQEKLQSLLDRYFDGGRKVVVAGLADGRKDPITGRPIPPQPIAGLIRLLEPEFDARAKQPEPRERLVILNCVIVNAPRKPEDDAWVKQAADAMQQYGEAALKRGASLLFFSEMVQPSHIAGRFGNKFRREGLRAFDELASRELPGIKRGPELQVLMERQRRFFRDDRHFSETGRDFIACQWLLAMLDHDRREIPDWLAKEIESLVSTGAEKNGR